MRGFLRIFVVALFVIFASPSFAENRSVNADAVEAVKMAEKAKRMAEEAERTASKVLAQEALRVADEARRLAEKAMRKVSEDLQLGESSLRQSTDGALKVQPAVNIAKDKKTKNENKIIEEKEMTKIARQAGTGPGISIKLGKTKMTFRGNFRMRFNMRDNLELNMPGGREDSTSYFDQRFRLNIEARRGPIRAVVLMDKGDIPRRWVQDSEGTSEKLGNFSTTNSFLTRWAYLQYVGNFSIKLGRQPLDAGHKIVLQGDMDAIDFRFNPFKKTTLGLSYMKVAGGYSSYSNTVTDYYTKEISRSSIFYAKNDLDAGILKLDWKPSRTIKLKGYTIKVVDHGGSGDADLNLDKDFNASTNPRDGGFDPVWVGLALKGRKNKLSYKSEIIYLTGSYTKNRDLNAYAVMLDSDYRIGKYTLGLGFGRGSGNKIDDSGDFKDFAGLFLCKFRNKYGLLFSEDINAGYFLFDSNLANITFLKFKGSRKMLKKKMKIGISYSLIRATEAVPEGRGTVNGFYSIRDDTLTAASSTAAKTTRDVGHEIDATWKYNLAKTRGLSVFANFGYFIPGNAYKQSDGTKADPASDFQAGMEFKF